MYWILFLLLFNIATAEEKPVKICLNMIVKDETKVIRRCLESAKPIIDYWVIVDTGSTDGTQKMIKEFMKDVPGELHERPWKNFGHNRNEALQLAMGKGDYILFIDADEVFELQPNYKKEDLKLTKDMYYITSKYGGMEYARSSVIKDHKDWQWKGVLHEYLENPTMKEVGAIESFKNVVHTDGFRSTDPEKFKKDALILEEAIAKEPDNSRYMFYLAQSWRDYGDSAKALKYYEQREKMGGWDQEVYWSMLQQAMMKEALNYPSEEIVSAYYKAYGYRPSRSEALYRLAFYYRRKGDYAAGYVVANTAMRIPPSTDILFVEKWMNDYGLPLEYSICAYWIGQHTECLLVSQSILSKNDIPENVRDCVQRNMEFATKAICPNLAVN